MTDNPQGSAAGSPAEPPTSGADVPADDSRSGADVADAIETAESGTGVREPHTRPEETKSGEAPVEQTYGDPSMTEGQTVTGSEATDATAMEPPPGPSPADAGSGGAQSVVGARVSDRLAAGEPQPAGGPFDTEADDTNTDAIETGDTETDTTETDAGK